MSSSRAAQIFFFMMVVGLGMIIRTPARAADSLSTPTIPDDPRWERQWYLRQIHAPEAWSVTTGTRNVIVAVIDGGVDITHPDLRDNMWVNEKEIPGDGIDNDGDGYVDDVHGWNFVTDSPDVRPVFKRVQAEEAWSHGTMIASLIGAKGNDATGMAGVAWNVRLLPLVVLDADGAGTTADIEKAIRYAVNHGASVINLSLVGYDYDEALDQLIRNAADAGVVIVAATGNDDTSKSGINLDDTPAYPVCNDGGRNAVLGVGGTDPLDQKAPYANYGRVCTDISAPAQSIMAARPTFPHGDATRAPVNVPKYAEDVTGTSLASPLVAGVAALIKSVRPAWTVAQIQERILQTADPIEKDTASGQKGTFGFGRLNAGRALAGLGPVEAVVTQAAVSSTPVISLSVFVTHTRTRTTSTQFVLQGGGEEQRWNVSGRVIQSGWLERDEGIAPFAYAWVRQGTRYRLEVWDPQTRTAQVSRPRLKGNGPWSVEEQSVEGGDAIFVFASRHSRWATEWNGSQKNGRVASRATFGL